MYLKLCHSTEFCPGLAKGTWILFLDADEKTYELAKKRNHSDGKK
jgi:hypothetical protein